MVSRAWCSALCQGQELERKAHHPVAAPQVHASKPGLTGKPLGVRDLQAWKPARAALPCERDVKACGRKSRMQRGSAAIGELASTLAR